MNLLRNRIINWQKKIIGIEPVVDMRNFVLLLLADLASLSKDLVIATLPFDYLENIECIMFSEKGLGIKFAKLIDIYTYYEEQSNWETEFNSTLSEVVKTENLTSKVDFEYACIEIQFTKDQVTEIRNRFDEEVLSLMKMFSNLLTGMKSARTSILEANERNRNYNRSMYSLYNELYREFIKQGIKNPKDYIEEFKPKEKYK